MYTETMHFIKIITFSVLAAIMPVQQVEAGPVAYGICQTGCAGVVVACYSAAGAVFGTVAAPVAPPALLACNGAFGACSAKCALIALAPTP